MTRRDHGSKVGFIAGPEVHHGYLGSWLGADWQRDGAHNSDQRAVRDDPEPLPGQGGPGATVAASAAEALAASMLAPTDWRKRT
jgi:hypothetical protein